MYHSHRTWRRTRRRTLLEPSPKISKTKLKKKKKRLQVVIQRPYGFQTPRWYQCSRRTINHVESVVTYTIVSLFASPPPEQRLENHCTNTSKTQVAQLKSTYGVRTTLSQIIVRMKDKKKRKSRVWIEKEVYTAAQRKSRDTKNPTTLIVQCVGLRAPNRPVQGITPTRRGCAICEVPRC